MLGGSARREYTYKTFKHFSRKSDVTFFQSKCLSFVFKKPNILTNQYFLKETHMQKLSWALNIVLLIIIATLLYMFLIAGNVEETEDGRTAVIVTKAERLHVLGDMRKFLEHVQSMVEAIGDKDMEIFSTAASGVGLIQEPTLPASLVSKMPLEFKTLGTATHTAFDDLAKLADESGDFQLVAQELSLIMSNCTYCHRSYRLEAEEK